MCTVYGSPESRIKTIAIPHSVDSSNAAANIRYWADLLPLVNSDRKIRINELMKATRNCKENALRPYQIRVIRGPGYLKRTQDPSIGLLSFGTYRDTFGMFDALPFSRPTRIDHFSGYGNQQIVRYTFKSPITKGNVPKSVKVTSLSHPGYKRSEHAERGDIDSFPIEFPKYAAELGTLAPFDCIIEVSNWVYSSTDAKELFLNFYYHLPIWLFANEFSLPCLNIIKPYATFTGLSTAYEAIPDYDYAENFSFEIYAVDFSGRGNASRVGTAAGYIPHRAPGDYTYLSVYRPFAFVCTEYTPESLIGAHPNTREDSFSVWTPQYDDYDYEEGYFNA